MLATPPLQGNGKAAGGGGRLMEKLLGYVTESPRKLEKEAARGPPISPLHIRTKCYCKRKLAFPEHRLHRRLAHACQHHCQSRLGTYYMPGTVPSMSHKLSQTYEVGTIIIPFYRQRN